MISRLLAFLIIINSEQSHLHIFLSPSSKANFSTRKRAGKVSVPVQSFDELREDV